MAAAAILDNFEWVYLRNGSQSTYTSRGHLCDSTAFLFIKKQLKAHKLPPTRRALHEAIIRAHYQAMVWYHDDIPTLSGHQQQAMAGKKKVID